MTAPKKKKQHFVPRFILRNFSSNDRSVPTFVLGSGKLHSNASIGDQCAQDYFYGRDGHMEEAFGQSERAVAPILKRVHEGDVSGFDGPYRTSTFPELVEQLDELKVHPLYLLREYVYYQHCRTAASAEALEDACDAELKWWLQRDPRFLKKIPDASELFEKVKIVPSSAIEQVLYYSGSFHFATLDLTVKFLVAEKPTFVLADHPVVLRNQYAEQREQAPGSLGIMARGLQMFMPVSPTITVAIYDADVYVCGARDGVVVRVSARNAAALNEMQVMNAHECLYVHPDMDTDLTELRSTWLRRPDRRSVRIEGALRPQGNGSFKQTVVSVAPTITLAPRVRCFEIHDPPRDEVRERIGDTLAFPIRSISLANGVQQFGEYLDWAVKESVKARGVRVAPGWRKWIDEIKDPRKTWARRARSAGR